MYPFFRLLKELFVHRNDPPLGLLETHVSQHLCWPWDIDIWMELNNGRTLTLYDLGRLPLGRRAGLMQALKQQGWGLVVAGASVRYRKRVKMFDRIEMRTRTLGWDARFFYIEQTMWVRGTCTSHLLCRSAVTDASGIVPTEKLVAALQFEGPVPDLPDWVEAWIEADAKRPWPPEM